MLSHLKMGLDINFQCLVSNDDQKNDKDSRTKFHVKKLSDKYKAPIRLPPIGEAIISQNLTYLTIP